MKGQQSVIEVVFCELSSLLTDIISGKVTSPARPTAAFQEAGQGQKFSGNKKQVVSISNVVDLSKSAVSSAVRRDSAVRSHTVSLIILENMEGEGQVGANKDSRKQSSKSRNRENIRIKVLNAMKFCGALGHMGGSDDVQVELLVNKSSASLARIAQGLVVAVEIPFRVLRNLNTLIMMYCQSSGSGANSSTVTTSKDEFEQFCGSEFTSKYRRNVKQLVTELVSYVKYASTNSSNSTQDSNVKESYISSAGDLPIQVRVFSLSDEKMDIITYEPALLNKLRWV